MQPKYKFTYTRLKIVLIIAISFFSFFAKGQDTDSVRIAINNILAPLNKALIPTGILAENSYPLLDLSVYNGQLTADNTIDFSQWRLLYNQALSGAYTAPVGLPGIAQLNTDYNAARNDGVNNVVSVSLINYASIKPTAITDGFMTVSNGQLFDNNPGSKYQTNRLFIAAAVNNTAKNGILNLLFNPNLFYSNTGLTITNLQVDFGNGNGFVTAGFNTTLSGVYTSIGNKQLIYKITFSDASVAQCYNNIYVPYIPPSNNASRYGGAPVDAAGADIPDVVLDPTNTHTGVDLFIRRTISNTAGSNANPQFIKPLIIVEGLDLSSATSLLGNGYNYNDFLREIINPDRTSFISGTNPLLPFDQYLDDVAGYDLIFVNWQDGVGDITQNALRLRDVINFVNAHKQAGAEQNVILGISMGGLVSRYCLAQMVKAGGTGINETQTRLLITHDSPHRGANIPLALQHLLQGLRKQRVKAFLGTYNHRLDEIIPQFQDVNTAINSPAATQQLLARVIDDNGTLSYNTFLDGAYRTMVNFDGTGFTQPYRFVATSNGSQCGIPVAAPYSQLASLDADGRANIFGLTLWTQGRAYLDMRRLPDLGQTSSILNFNLKLKVKILVFNLLKISMQIQKNAPGNLLPLDGLAGGTRDLGGAALSSNLSTLPPASGAANWLLFGYSYNFSTPYIAPTFSFVPTTSSLDVANFNAVNIPYVVPITGLNGSRSENYIAQERITLAAPIGVTNNVTHTDFYARTCNWLYNEMENIPNNIACLQITDCFSPVLPLSYDQNNCNEATVSTTANATAYTWQVTGDLLINGSVTTLTGPASSINITGTLGRVIVSGSFACGITVQGSIDYKPFEREIQGGYEIYVGNDHLSASVNTTPYDTYYRWYFNNDLVKEGADATYYCTCNYGINPRLCDQYNAIKVIVETSCSSSEIEYPFWWACTYRMQSNVELFPNPAKDQVNIRLVELKDESVKNRLKQINEVRILDKFGNTLSVSKYQETLQFINFNIDKLPADIYFIEISDGKNKARLQLSKQK
jgi:hypothetical protein